MQPTYGLCADIHLHSWSVFSTTGEDGVNSRLMGLLDELTRCAEETHAAGGRVVVVAGDVFHIRGSVKPSVLNPLQDVLRELHRTMPELRFVILAGNHDIEHRETTRVGSAVTALECDYVRVVNETTTMSDERIVLVPWFEDIGKLKAEIERVKNTLYISTHGGDTDIYDEFDLIIHAPIDGVIEGLPDHGLSPEYLASLCFRRVFAGHYHNHKVFPGNVYSIGALAHHSWTDIGSKAGFLLVDDKVTWRKSRLPAFVDLTALAEIVEDIDELPLLVDGNFVRAKVDSDSAKLVAGAREELIAMGAKGVVVMPMPTAPVREGSTPTSAASGASLELSVSEFIRDMKVPEGIDPAAISAACMSVLAAADAVEA